MRIYYAAYFVLAGALTVYSFVLIDPNLTFFQHPAWTVFRDAAVQIGYHNRLLSWQLYATLLLLLYGFHFFSLRFFERIQPLKVALVLGGVLLFSYPFLSHDFFNYLFDAKILTFYHKNPYLYRALDFESDVWLRFMHWTHRTYPYGPTFLPLTLIPSFLALGKFVLNFFFFKLMFVGFYILTVHYLNKLSKKWAVFFATHPLVLIEGVVVAHNDLIGVSFALIGAYYLIKEKRIRGYVFLLLSAGIKYITAPLLVLNKKIGSYFNLVALAGVSAMLLYLTMRSEIQPWYFLTLFVFLPFFEDLLHNIQIFIMGLLFAYYPYIYLGGWDSPDKVILKHQIIWWFFAINLIYIVWKLHARCCKK